MDYAHVVPGYQVAIPAAAGLVGVVIGGLITTYSQKIERRQRLAREKLDKFYSPLLGMRSHIKTKSIVREKIRDAARKEWNQLFVGFENDPEAKKRISETHGPKFDKITEYDKKQFESELLPLYRDMLAYFTSNISLAEDSTLKHYEELVEFVEMWNRELAGALPPEVVLAVGHDEKKLYPFYDDLAVQTGVLRNELNE